MVTLVPYPEKKQVIFAYAAKPSKEILCPCSSRFWFNMLGILTLATARRLGTNGRPVLATMKIVGRPSQATYMTKIDETAHPKTTTAGEVKPTGIVGSKLSACMVKDH